MKCDELQYERIGDANKTYPASTLIIRKQFVDAAIAELKAENERLNRELEHVKNGMESELLNLKYDVLEFSLAYPSRAEKDKWLTFKNPRIRIGTGRPEWGAEPGKMYFVISWEE